MWAQDVKARMWKTWIHPPRVGTQEVQSNRWTPSYRLTQPLQPEVHAQENRMKRPPHRNLYSDTPSSQKVESSPSPRAEEQKQTWSFQDQHATGQTFMISEPRVTRCTKTFLGKTKKCICRMAFYGCWKEIRVSSPGQRGSRNAKICLTSSSPVKSECTTRWWKVSQPQGQTLHCGANQGHALHPAVYPVLLR